VSADLPRITVVTPSFNQAQFLETTMLSVLGQCYPALEYIVMDGGSSDGSAEIIRKYEAQLAYWVSARDGGQSRRDQRRLSPRHRRHPVLAEQRRLLSPRHAASHRKDICRAHTRAAPVLRELPLLQPGRPAGQGGAAAPPRSTLAAPERLHHPAERVLDARVVGESRPTGGHVRLRFDWDWFIRASAVGHFETCDEILSTYRLHAAHKSGSGSERRRKEILEVARRHAAPEQIAAYEYFDRHWIALERRRTLSESLRRRRIPGADFWARLGSPLPSPPPGVSREDLRLCAGMLGGS